jgi:hypothetical protein
LLERRVYRFRIQKQCKWVRDQVLLFQGGPSSGCETTRRM